MASSLAPERVRHVRVAVVGDSGCGKSTLVSVLAGSVGDDARVSDAPVPRTVGVNARVRVVDVPDARGVAPPRPHFVELWDLGGRDEHEAERRVFYRDLDGVLLVHDLTLLLSPPRRAEDRLHARLALRIVSISGGGAVWARVQIWFDRIHWHHEKRQCPILCTGSRRVQSQHLHLGRQPSESRDGGCGQPC